MTNNIPTAGQSQISADDSEDFSLGLLLEVFVQRRRSLLIITVACGLLSAIVAHLLPSKYSSTAELMPPDQQSIANSTALSQMAGVNSMLGAGGGGLMSQRTPGQTVVGILSSDSVLDWVIEKNNLSKVYHTNYIEDARKELLTHSDLSEDKKSGIILISVTANDKALAHNIVSSYLDRLNQLMGQLSTSSAQRERIFLEQRLSELKAQLSASTAALGQFASNNSTLDPQRQGSSSLEAASRLQGQLITAESDLSGLRTRFTDTSPQVRTAQARVDELRQELNILSGDGQARPTQGTDKDRIAPSIRDLPILAGKYAELSRDVGAEELLYQTFSRQYELARVEEAKVTPTVRILDPASYPQKRSGPNRLMITVVGAVGAFLVSFMYFLCIGLWAK